jgi:hypothetical protein
MKTTATATTVYIRLLFESAVLEAFAAPLPLDAAVVGVLLGWGDGVAVGVNVGIDVGDVLEGMAVGIDVGIDVGDVLEGTVVGMNVGWDAGWVVLGATVGDTVGKDVGLEVGVEVGTALEGGVLVGVGVTGAADTGAVVVGDTLGDRVGAIVGAAVVGIGVGLVVVVDVETTDGVPVTMAQRNQPFLTSLPSVDHDMTLPAVTCVPFGNAVLSQYLVDPIDNASKSQIKLLVLRPGSTSNTRTSSDVVRWTQIAQYSLLP